MPPLSEMSGHATALPVSVGYSMSTARTRFGTFTVVGAPRADHRGQVMVTSPGRSDQTLQFTGQVGVLLVKVLMK